MRAVGARVRSGSFRGAGGGFRAKVFQSTDGDGGGVRVAFQRRRRAHAFQPTKDRFGDGAVHVETAARAGMVRRGIHQNAHARGVGNGVGLPRRAGGILRGGATRASQPDRRILTRARARTRTRILVSVWFVPLPRSRFFLDDFRQSRPSGGSGGSCGVHPLASPRGSSRIRPAPKQRRHRRCLPAPRRRRQRRHAVLVRRVHVHARAYRREHAPRVVLRGGGEKRFHAFRTRLAQVGVRARAGTHRAESPIRRRGSLGFMFAPFRLGGTLEPSSSGLGGDRRRVRVRIGVGVGFRDRGVVALVLLDGVARRARPLGVAQWVGGARVVVSTNEAAPRATFGFAMAATVQERRGGAGREMSAGSSVLIGIRRRRRCRRPRRFFVDERRMVVRVVGGVCDDRAAARLCRDDDEPGSLGRTHAGEERADVARERVRVGVVRVGVVRVVGGILAADRVVVAVVAALEGTRAGAYELADDVVASTERGELDERDAATQRPPPRAREPRRGRDWVVEAKLAELHHAETRHRSLVDGVHERARLRLRRRATVHVETELQRVVRLAPRASAKVLVHHGAVARRRAMWLAR